HTGEQAASSATTLAARAFTVGDDIAFGHGRFAPGTAEGSRLLAHELSHVVQQRGSAATPATAQTLESPGLEQQADTAAARVTAGDSAGTLSPAPAGGVQRAPDGQSSVTGAVVNLLTSRLMGGSIIG